MLNVVAIMGRLVADPELKITPAGISVCTFRIACDRNFVQQGQQRQADFIDVVAWRHNADFLCKYFAKGSMVAVSGRLQIRDWTDREGNKRRSAEVVADNVYFGESKRREDSDSGYGRSNYDAPRRDGHNYAASSPAVDSGRGASAFAELEDDDGDLPF